MLERDLDNLDIYDLNNNPSILLSRDEDDTRHKLRKEILLKTEHKFREYGNVLLKVEPKRVDADLTS
jgi:hypothetical protein